LDHLAFFSNVSLKATYPVKAPLDVNAFNILRAAQLTKMSVPPLREYDNGLNKDDQLHNMTLEYFQNEGVGWPRRDMDKNIGAIAISDLTNVVSPSAYPYETPCTTHTTPLATSHASRINCI
jgi:hypothetical protein